MKIKKERNFKLLFFLLILSSVFCDGSYDDEISQIRINQTVKGKMDNNDDHRYFKIVIPEDIESGKSLIFTVQENRDDIKEGEEIFSDPDIYISTKHKKPNDKATSEWYSERYGNDILTVPSKYIKSGQIFYIGMYCQYKCRYELHSYLTGIQELVIGKVYTQAFSSPGTINYKLNIGRNDFEELNVVATTPELKSFRLFMSKESPSSQNTFTVIPSWTGGYTISIDKLNQNYCTLCSYEILIQALEPDVEVQLIAYFQDSITKLKTGNPLTDVVKKYSKRCYSYYILGGILLSNEKLILQTTLFSGSVTLHISGWNKQDANRLSTNELKSLYTYDITNEKVIMLTKSDINYFNDNYQNEDDNKKSSKGYLNFCIYGKQTSSYIVNIYPLSKAQELQKYNYLTSGSETLGYLDGGKVTRYRILDFNQNKNSNITINFESLQGKVNSYVTFCSKSCMYTMSKLNNEVNSNNLLLPKRIGLTRSEFFIQSKDNKCYEDNDKNCKTVVIISCEGTNKDLCSYKLTANFEDQTILMLPKKTYYNIIPKDKKDYYEILITDQTVESIVIVLSTVTGDAQLSVKIKKDATEVGKVNEDKLLGISMNKDYIPDLVRITPQKIGKSSVEGRYVVIVYAEVFSSYNLYYYTTRTVTEEEKRKPLSIDLSLNLKDGEIIKDYFQNNLPFKTYLYTPQDSESRDIKIILTRVNVKFSFYVYTKLEDIKVNLETTSLFDEKFEGYKWASDQNDEVTISTKDPDYKPQGPYYIVVAKGQDLQTNKEDIDRNALIIYYLGCAKKGIPFTLYEGIEHSETLSNDYKGQSYFYMHGDNKEPFQLDINMLNGEVDIIIDTQMFSEEYALSAYKKYNEKNVEKNQNLNENDENTKKKDLTLDMIKKNLDKDLPLRTSTFIYPGANSHASISLKQSYFNQFCKKNYGAIQNCGLYIYIIQSQNSLNMEKNSQYIITAKSSQTYGTLLKSGQILTSSMSTLTEKHFFIEEVKHRKGCTINVKFSKGTGSIYVRIPEMPESGRIIKYPNSDSFDYKGEDSYMGKVVKIPSHVFDKINQKSLKLQILISIVGETLGDNNEISFSITYTSEAKRISQNVPYTHYVNAGEYNYFIFYFDGKAENIYISLSNMNGDADLYLNYGNSEFPSPGKHDWYSISTGHEFIEISSNDQFFKKNKKPMKGYYTLLVVGYTDTTYTLYISSHDFNVFSLKDNSPINCKCNEKNDKCFYRYDNVYQRHYSNMVNMKGDLIDDDDEEERKESQIIFTTQYLYGSGVMYANLMKQHEINTNDQGKKYIDFFPDQDKNHFSSIVSGKKNYMEIKVPKEKYGLDALILLTYVCSEKTDVEVTATSINEGGFNAYLNINRENMYFLKYNPNKKKQKESILAFYSNKDENLIYEFHGYLGKAKIKVYTNESIWDNENNLLNYRYNHLASFKIDATDDTEFENKQDGKVDYFNSISSSLSKGKTIFFSIIPSEDFGFYTQIQFEKSWVNVPANKEKSYYVRKHLYGYFDVLDFYDSVEMSISLKDFLTKKAMVYVKVIIADKNLDYSNSNNLENKLVHYEIASSSNYDIKAETDGIVGSVNININDLPKIKAEDKGKKYVRAIFQIVLHKVKRNITSSLNDDVNKIAKNYNRGQKTYSSGLSDTLSSMVKIYVTPGVNNYKRIDLSQNTIYFSNTTLIRTRKNYLDDFNTGNINMNNNFREKETQVYSLDKSKDEHRNMLIQINKCSGNYDISLSEKIFNKDESSRPIEYFETQNRHGQYYILAKNIKKRHIYLTVKPSQNIKECSTGLEKDSNGIPCNKELSYLLSYYSTNKQNLLTQNRTDNVTFLGASGKKIRLSITDYRQKLIDKFNNAEEDKFEYTIIWTTNSSYLNELENICYLRQLLIDQEDKILNPEINIINGVQHTSKGEFLINNMNSKKKIYLSILEKNLVTNQLKVYAPIEFKIKSNLLRNLFLIIIILIIGYFSYTKGYKYYKEMKEDYYSGTQRLPSEEIEMRNTRSLDEIRYSGLSQRGY